MSGTDYCLGPHNSLASRAEYDRLVAEWLAAGRVPLDVDGHDITVVEVAARYWDHAQTYYQKDGRPTQEVANIKLVPPKRLAYLLNDSCS